MRTSADKFARLAALRPVRRVEVQSDVIRTNQPLPQTEEECMLARMIGATVARTKFGSHLTVRNWHATPEFCPPSVGVIELLQNTGSRKRWNRKGPRPGKTAEDPEKETGGEINGLLQDPERWLFLDTETTGLSGGTGTYAFLIGIAWWDSGGLQVEQFLMRDFSEEHSVLLELAERLAQRPVLVTFNGKTFDWPLLESRYLMTRTICVPQLTAHLDLLHPARAVWKLRLGSVRLMELEEHVLDARRLGWDRADDVPSNMIPQFYFDYLRGRSVAPLAGVVRHNRNDLRGLAALFGKLNEMLSCDEHSDEADGLDLFGLSRYLDRRGERRRAEVACLAARERGLPIGFDAEAQWELARMAKRRGEHEMAAAIWNELARDADWQVAAWEELASYYERRRREFSTALKYARQAIAALNKRASDGRLGGQAGIELRRFERLKKKIRRLEIRMQNAASTGPLLQRVR
jgi:uncharacterized protein YprB with RNaseH-like and TPR domain